jgi:hypothetical protein
MSGIMKKYGVRNFLKSGICPDMKNSGQISDRQNWTNSGHKKSWTYFGQSLDKKNRTNSGS